MFEFQSDESRLQRQQRRSAIRMIYPCLTSPRLVRLVRALILLAATRPDSLATVEEFVHRLQQRPRVSRATLRPSKDRRRSE